MTTHHNCLSPCGFSTLLYLSKMSHLKKMFLLSTFLIIFSVTADAYKMKIGDACMLKTNSRGVCRPFEKCRSAVADWSHRNTLPLLCPSGGKRKIVCCDEHHERHTYFSTKVGDSCEYDRGKRGVCLLKHNCPSARNNPSPTICRFNLVTSVPVICCEMKRSSKMTLIMSTTTTTLQSDTYSIAAKKCNEYSKWLIGDDKTRRAGVCATTATEPALMIFGGTAAKRLEFPHMAHLGYAEEYETDLSQLKWECGGSLISERYVLTAAHCLKDRAGMPVHSVRLGNDDLTKVHIHKVVDTFQHKSHNPPELYHDIALLKLDRPVTFSDLLRPACLQTDKTLNSDFGVATGWGITEKRKRSDKLLKVTLPFSPVKNCSLSYRASDTLPRGIDDDTMVCAGTVYGQKDACQGDSGGPLQILLEEPECMYSIIGVTSFGVKCGLVPGVYTRVSAYIPWIESIVWPNL